MKTSAFARIALPVTVAATTLALLPAARTASAQAQAGAKATASGPAEQVARGRYLVTVAGCNEAIYRYLRTIPVVKNRVPEPLPPSER